MVWGSCVGAGAFVEITHHTISVLFHKARSTKHFIGSKNWFAQQNSCVQVCWHYLLPVVQFNFSALQEQGGAAGGEQILLLLSLQCPVPGPWLSLGWGTGSQTLQSSLTLVHGSSTNHLWLQRAVCTVKRSCWVWTRAEVQPWSASAVSRLGSLQGTSFLKGGAIKNIFRKGLFLCAYSQNGPRVKSILAVFPSLIYS